MKYTLDATDKKVGRLASDIAVLLMGKNRSDYTRNKIPDITVEVENASKISVEAKKLESKEYHSHSGYPGALKVETAAHVVAKKGMGKVLKKAVSGMLPKNKLRPQMLKRLIIKE